MGGTGLTARLKCQPPPGVDASPPPIATYTAIATHTATGTLTVTFTETSEGTETATLTETVTGTSVHTVTLTETAISTGTIIATSTETATATAPETVAQTGTSTATATETQTATVTLTLTNTVTSTVIQTQTLTQTLTDTVTNTTTATNSTTATLTVTNTLTGTGTLTRTYTASRVNSGTITSLWTFTAWGTHTVQLQATNTGTSFVTNNMAWGPGTATMTGLRSNVTMTGTDSASATATYIGNERGTATASWTQPLNSVSYTWTGTAKNTTARVVTGTGTWTFTQNRVVQTPWTGSATFTRTATGVTSTTSTGTATAGQTATETLTATGTATASATSTSTGTATSTTPETSTTTGIGTETYVTTQTVTTTQTITTTNTITTSSTYTSTSTATTTTSSTSTATGTQVETDTETISVTGTRTATVTDTNTMTQTGTDTLTETMTVTVTSTVDGGTGLPDAGNSAQCLADWRNTACGHICLQETQSDRQACRVFLDCYRDHACGPTTCGGQDDVCGVNVLNRWGTAPKTIADQVFQCLECPGAPSQPGERINATAQLGCGDPSGTVDGTQSFAPSVFFRIPSKLPVVKGSAGNGSATLTLTRDSTCADQCSIVCTYRGKSSQSHPVTLVDKLKGASYYLDSCSTGIPAFAAVYIRALALHIASGDCQSGPTRVVCDGYSGKPPNAPLMVPWQVYINRRGFEPPPSPGEPIHIDGGLVPSPPESPGGSNEGLPLELDETISRDWFMPDGGAPVLGAETRE